MTPLGNRHTASKTVAAAIAVICIVALTGAAQAQSVSEHVKSQPAEAGSSQSAPLKSDSKDISAQDRQGLSDLIEQAAPVAAPGKGAMLQPDAAPTKDQVVSIVLVGDTGYAPNAAPVSAKGVTRHGHFQRWADTTSAIAKHIDGDLNFANLETVVTNHNKLTRDTKGQKGPFNFRTHPAGIRHLINTGFNIVSLANNHSMDYGVGGLRETLKHMEDLKQKTGLLAYAGIGMNREQASRPVKVPVKGATIQFAATGIVTNNLARHRAGPDKPGQIAYRFDSDFDEVTKRLAEAPADYRILSIHYGVEGRVRADARQKKEWRGKAVRERGIDLIVGHHAHVVRGVERVGDKIIFYGLGNFLHHGTANMSGKGVCRSYGLLAKVHLLPSQDGTLKARAIQVVPLTAMHAKTQPYKKVASSHARIHALNYLARDLDNAASGAKGVRFTPQRDGTGLYCFPGSKNDPGKIGALCQSWKPAPKIPGSLSKAIQRSCAK